MSNDALWPGGLRPPDPPPEIAGPLGELQKRVSLRSARTHDEFMTALSDVLHESDAFLDVFGGYAWGRIVWEKDVGVPLSPNMADAFVFTHQFEEIHDEGVGANGVADGKQVYKDAPTPRVWDGPHDDQHYRVSFMLYGQPGYANGIGIDLDRNVPWEPSFAPWLDQRMRYVKYPAALEGNAGIFWPQRDKMKQLDDFRVLWWPF